MSGKRAFTYVELMLVLTIILVLSVIAIPNFREAQTRAQISRSQSDLMVLKTALSEYHLDHHTWPSNATPGAPDGESLRCLTTPVSYIGALPIDAITDPEASQRVQRLGLGPHYYQYYNALQASESESLRLYAPPHFPAALESSPEGNDVESWRAALRGLASDDRLPLPDQDLRGPISHLLWGHGPSVLHPQFDKSAAPPEIVFTAPDEAFVIAYDPTNGTASSGFIFTKLP